MDAPRIGTRLATSLARLAMLAAAVTSASALSLACASQIAPTSQPAGVPAFDVAGDLALGQALLKEGDAANAREVFESALKVEPANARAMHGLALSYFVLDQKDKAVIYIERAIRAAPNDRAIVNNLAAIRMATNEPMRAVKTVSDYLLTLPKANTLDEPLVDALGAALANCDERTRKARQWATGDDVLQQAVARLERARPGHRKLGTEWVTAGEWAKIDAHNKAQRDEIDRLGRRAADVQRQLDASQQRRADILRKMRTGFATQGDLDGVDQQIEQLEGRLASIRERAEASDQRIRRPVWASGLSILAIDASAPPAFDRLPPGADVAGTDRPRDRDLPADPVDPPDATPPGVLFPPANSNPADPVEAAPKIITRHAAAFAIGANRVVTSALAVGNASSLRVHLPDGSDRRALVVRVDADLGLAIVEVPGAQLAPIRIADRSAEGKATVVSFPALSLFEPRAATLPATVTQLDGELAIVMEKSPGLSGGPALVDGAIAGVVMADRFDVTPPVRLITAEKLRAFLGDDAPNDAAPIVGEPEPAVLLVTAEHGGTPAAPRGDDDAAAAPGTATDSEPVTQPNRPRRRGNGNP